MNPTPAGHEPHRPTEDGTLAPTAPGQATLQPLTKTQKILTGIVVGAVLVIATLGFIGSYAAVTRLAIAKGFGEFAHAFPIAVDAGIIAFLALDLLLTWRRIPFPLLRYTAWGLTAATIAFNAVVSWPDPVGTGMHGVIPVLFVIAVEAARHAVGRIADITADKHIEGPNVSRWLLNPAGTFILWRRQRLWGIRRWDTVLKLERERRIYKGKLRKEHGRGWRWKATAEQLLVLRLATKDGMSVTEAIELPAREEEKRRQEKARIALEQQQAEDERRRKALAYEQEKQRLEDERRHKAEADRLEQERKALEMERQREEADRQRLIAEAETRARLEEIARQQREAAAEAERRSREAQAEAERLQRAEQLEHARLLADEQQRAATAAKARKDAEETARLEAERKLEASRRAAEMLRAANASAIASASTTAASRPATASRTAASVSGQTASPVASASANAQPGSASGTATSASPATASTAATTTTATNANASQAAATSASSAANSVDIKHVVDVYQLLEQQEGKAPSDAKLGAALGVSRSRAQQLRTAAIDAGHAELAKPVRLAS